MTADPSARNELLRRFFAGATEYAFAVRMGVVDPPLVDYVSEMLVRFVKSDAIYGVRNPARRAADAGDRHAGRGPGPAGRRPGGEMHRHIGDFTLFWTGVYPEIADRMRQGRKDSLLDYRDQGKRNYYLASTLPADDASGARRVLKRLSDNFELCVYGLGEVRRQWEHARRRKRAAAAVGVVLSPRLSASPDRTCSASLAQGDSTACRQAWAMSAAPSAVGWTPSAAHARAARSSTPRRTSIGTARTRRPTASATCRAAAR